MEHLSQMKTKHFIGMGVTDDTQLAKTLKMSPFQIYVIVVQDLEDNKAIYIIWFYMCTAYFIVHRITDMFHNEYFANWDIYKQTTDQRDDTNYDNSPQFQLLISWGFFISYIIAYSFL